MRPHFYILATAEVLTLEEKTYLKRRDRRFGISWTDISRLAAGGDRGQCQHRQQTWVARRSDSTAESTRQAGPVVGQPGPAARQPGPAVGQPGPAAAGQ